MPNSDKKLPIQTEMVNLRGTPVVKVMNAERVFLARVTQESIAQFLSSGKSRGGKTSIVSPAEAVVA
jgi:hypothetical protein